MKTSRHQAQKFMAPFRPNISQSTGQSHHHNPTYHFAVIGWPFAYADLKPGHILTSVAESK
jgi:hypothetical protein